MKLRIVIALSAVVSLALAAVAFAAPSPYKVTGGGQILASADSSGVKGPGDTISFQANIAAQGLNNTPETVSGAVNVIDRNPSATTKKGQGTHYKGTVNCAFLASDSTLGGGYVELYGNARNTKTDASVPFQLRIQDNGQGADNTDAIEFTTNPDETCGENQEQEPPTLFLARGNAKIHKQNPSTTSSSSASAKGTKTSSTSLTSLSTFSLR